MCYEPEKAGRCTCSVLVLPVGLGEGENIGVGWGGRDLLVKGDISEVLGSGHLCCTSSPVWRLSPLVLLPRTVFVGC